MKPGMLLFTFNKDVFYNEYGPHAIDLIKKDSSYRGETPKTITFELGENATRKEALSFLLHNLEIYMNKFKEQLRIKYERENKYAGRTIIDV